MLKTNTTGAVAHSAASHFYEEGEQQPMGLPDALI